MVGPRQKDVIEIRRKGKTPRKGRITAVARRILRVRWADGFDGFVSRDPAALPHYSVTSPDGEERELLPATKKMPPQRKGGAKT